MTRSLSSAPFTSRGKTGFCEIYATCRSSVAGAERIGTTTACSRRRSWICRMMRISMMSTAMATTASGSG